MIQATRDATIVIVLAIQGLPVADLNAAQLIGATVNVSAYHPDSLTIFTDPGNTVVSTGIEYPAHSYFPYSSSWQVDLTEDQWLLTDVRGNGFPFFPATFNGFILEVILGPRILAASIDPASGFSPISITVENGKRILANFQGVAGPVNSTSIINFVVVPEPGAVIILGTGLGIFIRRRARRGPMFCMRRRRPDNRSRICLHPPIAEATEVVEAMDCE